MPPEGPFWFPLPRRDPGARDDDGPATSRHAGIDDVGAAVVDCGVYDEGLRQGGRVELETALNRADSCRDGFVWIGLHDPAPGVVEKLGERFGIPPLAVEDAVHAHQRPKLETTDTTLSIIFKTARYIDAEELVEIGELMLYIGPRFVITVRHGDASPLAGLGVYLQAHPDLVHLGRCAVLYAVEVLFVDV